MKERVQEIQDVCLQVQEGLGMAASMGERVKKYVRASSSDCGHLYKAPMVSLDSDSNRN